MCVSDVSKLSVLVPGAGLGRLAWEIARLGYMCQGNEWSFFMLFSSNYVLNRYEFTLRLYSIIIIIYIIYSIKYIYSRVHYYRVYVYMYDYRVCAYIYIYILV